MEEFFLYLQENNKYPVEVVSELSSLYTDFKEKKQKQEQDKNNKQIILHLKEKYQKNMDDARELAKFEDVKKKFDAIYALKLLFPDCKGHAQTSIEVLENSLEMKYNITYTSVISRIETLKQNDDIGQCPSRKMHTQELGSNPNGACIICGKMTYC